MVELVALTLIKETAPFLQACFHDRSSSYIIFCNMFSSFMGFILLFVFLTFQLTELYGKSPYQKSYFRTYSTDGKPLSRGQKTKKSPDLSNCKSDGSLCDTVQQLSSIHSFLHAVTREHPQASKLKVIGKSYRHQPIYSVEIFRGDDPEEATTVVVEFGMHGREWASQASAVYTILRLLEHGRNLTKTIRWFILPMLNPDGYNHSVTEDNMWKMNRRPHHEKACFGVDVDRNFGVGWHPNTDPESCKDDYAGPQPFSEFESTALRSFMGSLGPFAVDIYVSVHSCGQAILYPYSHAAKKLSKWKLKRLTEVGSIMAKAMKKLRNRNYDVDAAYKFGGFRGSTADYMFDHFFIPYVYTLELGDRAYFEEYDFHHCYHPLSMLQMAYLTKECYAGITALAAHVSAIQEIANDLQIAHSFNSFSVATYSCVNLIAFITLLL